MTPLEVAGGERRGSEVAGMPLWRRPLPPSKEYMKAALESGRTRNKRVSRSRSLSEQGAREAGTLLAPPNTSQLASVVSPPQDASFVIHPLYPKGPPFLPPGRVLTQEPVIMPTELLALEQKWASSWPQRCNEFTLNDFLLAARRRREAVVSSQLKRPVISRENYLKMTGWFATHVPKQRDLHTVHLQVDVKPPQPHKPKHQLIVELQAMLKEYISESDSEMIGPSPLMMSDSEDLDYPIQLEGDALIHSAPTHFFCGEGRNDSPFDYSEQPFISPPEMMVLDSMLTGGERLSLKAHFLSELPNLQPLAHTLTYLNVAFNELKTFPLQILDLAKLTCLKMRNNPIREIPSEIRNLKQLQVFHIPFTLLTELPTGLFDLEQLRELDVSHNHLQWLSEDIGKLRCLQKFSVEYNLLSGLPATILSLTSLTCLSVDNNYFHPALWQENARNQPQALVDLCCVAVSMLCQNTFQCLPAQQRSILESCSSGSVCSCCHGPIFGQELRLIRAAGGPDRQFGAKLLPLILTVCSLSCRRQLKHWPTLDWDHNADRVCPGTDDS